MVLLGFLAGCGQKPAGETTPTTATTLPAPAASTPVATGVTRAEVVSPATPVRAALDTQSGPKGTQVALTKALVRGDILTVELQYTVPPSAESAPTFYEKIEQINYIDEATSKKYGVLKNQEGVYMASPLYPDIKEVKISLTKAGPVIVILKFPALPASSQTISLSIPEAGSFDGITVQR